MAKASGALRVQGGVLTAESSPIIGIIGHVPCETFKYYDTAVPNVLYEVYEEQPTCPTSNQ